MPKSISSLRLFVASPADLDEERKILAGVVQELNSYLPQQHGIFIDLISLDAHVSPGVGTDPQNVINQKLSSDCDIVIAMFWTRIGSPTPRAQSGTVEEIENAYARWQENSDSVRLMVYFKNTPISPSNIDPDQIKQLNEYQDRLGKKGIYYVTFSDSDGLSQLLRLHIADQAIELLKADRTDKQPIEVEGIPKPASKPQSITDDEGREEEGFLDLIDTTVKTLNSSTELLNEITDSLKSLNSRTHQTTHELDSVDKEDQHKFAKLILISNRQAQNMQNFVFQLKPIIPIFDESLSSGLDA